MGIKRYKNAIREARANGSYLKCLAEPVSSKTVMLDWGQGMETEDNSFALFKYKQRNTMKFREAFATAGHIITNGPLPAYFIKREGQRITVEGNGFHHDYELGLAQKTLLIADEITCDNQETKKNLIEKYMVRALSSEEGAELFYVGDLTRTENCFLAEKIVSAHSKNNGVIAFEGEIKPNVKDFMKKMEGKAEFLQILPDGAVTFMDYVNQYLYKNRGWAEKKANSYYEREYNRLFRDLKINNVHFVNTEMYERIEILLKCKCTRTVHAVPMNYYRKLVDVFCSNGRKREELFERFDEIVRYENDFGSEIWNSCFCSGISAKLRNARIKISDDSIVISGGLEIIAEDSDATIDECFLLGSTIHEKRFSYDMGITGEQRERDGNLSKIRCSFNIDFPIEDITGWYNINLPCVQINSGGSKLCVPVLVSKRNGIKGGLVHNLSDTGYALEIREDYRHLRFVIRQANVTDRRSEKIKIGLAFACSIITFWNKPVVLYEKYCRKYEESASILYEKLVDDGYRNARFILNGDCMAADSVPDRYRKYIVKQFSFSHYYNLFAAGSIFASEALGHSMEKGTASSLFKTFVLDGSKNYVFLQHGVMYMVALSSEQRNFFRKGKGKGKQRVVVSSELEAAHFIENTNYEPEDIYNCGLIKFDRSELEEGADRIMVMLTWRPWEFVTGMAGMEKTGYYRMLKRIVEAVPEQLRDRLVVMPHPLVVDQIKMKADDDVWKYFVPNLRYEDILRKTKLIITDYSSISYDAFFRGSNVIFDWEEKDQCMREYGENGHLMLTEELAFGPVCKGNNNLRMIIEESYRSGQKEEYISNYRKIVEHHDGHNVDRFVEMVRKDGLLR